MQKMDNGNQLQFGSQQNEKLKSENVSKTLLFKGMTILFFEQKDNVKLKNYEMVTKWHQEK